jgi:hypothetical protein
VASGFTLCKIIKGEVEPLATTAERIQELAEQRASKNRSGAIA